MQYLDLTLETPAENLALEEALLLASEDTLVPVLRLWESSHYFVVLGAGRPRASDCDLDTCLADNVPVFRRCSGGGTVLQGRGCLNYTLVLPKSSDPELETIGGTNRWILGRVLTALQLAGAQDLSLAGTSDLIDLDGQKFSGNAQRRRKEMILFHGTILHEFNLDLVSRYLREPDSQPDYREGRNHSTFIRNLPIDVTKFKSALREQFAANVELSSWPAQNTAQLVHEKYLTSAWNESF